MEQEAGTFERLRPLLFSIAYRMIGSVTEAEDVVQEAFIRYHRAGADGERIAEPKAWLSAVTTRLAIDHLRSARVRRETYVGPWLPEPVVERTEDVPSASAELADSLSLAFLLVLERLNPVERAVFLLREVFDFGYDEIAEIVERNEDNCRQLATRARRHVEEERPRFRPSREHQAELTLRFLEAVSEGDTDGLVGMLAEDVALYSDSGGRVQAARRKVAGPKHVARLMTTVARAGAARQGFRLVAHEALVNGESGMLLVDLNTGMVVTAFQLDIAPSGLIRQVLIVLNPDKLGGIVPPAGPGVALN